MRLLEAIKSCFGGGSCRSHADSETTHDAQPARPVDSPFSPTQSSMRIDRHTWTLSATYSIARYEDTIQHLAAAIPLPSSRSLLDLPAEIRKQIYNLVSEDMLPECGVHILARVDVIAPLAETSQQLRAKFLPVYHGNRTLVVPDIWRHRDDDTFFQWLDLFGRSRVPLYRTFRLEDETVHRRQHITLNLQADPVITREACGFVVHFQLQATACHLALLQLMQTNRLDATWFISADTLLYDMLNGYDNRVMFLLQSTPVTLDVEGFPGMHGMSWSPWAWCRPD